MVAAIGNGAAFRKDATSAPGSGWCRSRLSTGDRASLGERSRRGNRCRALFVQAAWVCWSGSGQRVGTAMGSSPGSRPRKSGSTTTCWRSRSPTSSPASPGRFSTRSANSSASGRTRCRPEPLECRAVLGPVKAWPGNAEAGGRTVRRPAWTAPGRRAQAQAGRRNGLTGTNKGTGSNWEHANDVTPNSCLPRSARG